MSVIGIHTSSLVSASRHGKCGGFWASWVFPGVHQGTRQVATPPNHPMCWIRATGSFFPPERLLPESRPPGRTAPARHRHEEEVSTRVPKQGGNNKKPQGHTNNQNFVEIARSHFTVVEMVDSQLLSLHAIYTQSGSFIFRIQGYDSIRVIVPDIAMTRRDARALAIPVRHQNHQKRTKQKLSPALPSGWSHTKTAQT